MPRFKKYLSNAEKQAAFRLQHPDKIRVLSPETMEKNRLRAANHRNANPLKHQQSINRLTKWAKMNPAKAILAKQTYKKTHTNSAIQPFIAIDGEGVTRDHIFTVDKKTGEKLFQHDYTLLSSSLNLSVENWKDGGLSTQGCFEFLWKHLDKGILVAFGSNYDVNMMLRDIPKDSLLRLWRTNECEWNGWKISWLKSKMFTLAKDKRRLTIYEVFGFFQASFVETLVDWKIIEKDDPTYQMLSENKAARNVFQTSERKQIKNYNLEECRLLVILMDKLRQATIEAGCLPKSWHGAATLAKAMAFKHGVKEHIQTPDTLRMTFLRAYYGGRSQILQQGEFDKAYGHDLSSAYPSALRNLPSSQGKWYSTKTYKPQHQWALYKVQWKTKRGEVLNPFPFREDGEIYYPPTGMGWYWKPEIDAAMELYGDQIEILEGKIFLPSTDIKPFEFINAMYEQRRKFKSEGNDAQKALKLGMNSLYGITAQSIGYQGSNPPFQNYFYAGYTTSTCRASVLRLAYPKKKTIIAFATDGVFASERLTHDVPGLGGWETDEIDNLFMVQSGVYAFGFEDSAQPIKKKSRGFHKKSVDYDKLRVLWRKDGNLATYDYTETRFFGLGNAFPSLEKWRKWVECKRQINFTISAQFTEQAGGILRIIPDLPKREMSEAYEPHKTWEEKDAAMNETHCD